MILHTHTHTHTHRHTHTHTQTHRHTHIHTHTHTHIYIYIYNTYIIISNDLVPVYEGHELTKHADIVKVTTVPIWAHTNHNWGRQNICTRQSSLYQILIIMFMINSEPMFYFNQLADADGKTKLFELPGLSSNQVLKWNWRDKIKSKNQIYSITFLLWQKWHVQRQPSLFGT